MLGWLIYNREAADYNKQYIDFYREEGERLGITVKLILVEEIEFGVGGSGLFIKVLGQQEQKPDFAISRVVYPLLSKQLECMGIPVFNNSTVAEICNDKSRTCQYLARTGIPIIESSFYRNDQLRYVFDRIDRPTIIKAVDGHGGRQVYLLYPKSEKNNEADESIDNLILHEEQAELLRIIKGLGGSDLIVQPLIGSKHQDLRVYVIGDQIIGAVLRTAKQGFKSNFSLGGEVVLYQLSREERLLVHTIISQFDFGLVGIDFIIGDEGELIFNEIEDVVGSRMLYQCSNINIVELYLKYIISKIEYLYENK